MTILRSRFPLRHALVTLVLALAPFCARGVESDGHRLESQPLWVELNRFAEQKGFQLLYSMDQVVEAGRSRPMGDCRFADRCLAQLLDRKGLQYEYRDLEALKFRGRVISIQRALPARPIRFEPSALLRESDRIRSRLMSGTRAIWTASQLATRKSGLRSLRLATTDRLEVLPSQAIVVTRTEALEIESRIYYAPCPAPDEEHFDLLEPVCSARRTAVERQSVSLVKQALVNQTLFSETRQPVSAAARRLEVTSSGRLAVVSAIPATRLRIIRPASPRAPPFAV